MTATKFEISPVILHLMNCLKFVKTFTEACSITEYILYVQKFFYSYATMLFHNGQTKSLGLRTSHAFPAKFSGPAHTIKCVS